MGKVIYGRGYVYTIQYHIVWCTKYRHKILQGKVEKTLKEIIKQIAQDNQFRIEEIETDLDHIHLLIDCSPQHYIPNIIKALKGVSARLLFKAHPEIKKQLWGGHLWNPSYFVATVSENTQEQIREYIRGQKTK
ncbi:IS200/IS605 family transposase [Alkalicella caledoniensis]|uniref:IS200/IS605 family transposase n=1 Tax=Alkalicella caledoniensis TaxID=2731377 RepID=A0A7G9WB01_ALKCA|nr:IS200/IS605 family transposase [Alkalicella caledoniensis]QNO15416.1 IS200/IS605 family transposase [Alkalicella caledoniensis]QNO15863.1 IS200/IS605 family transposase [Alkalicella caledoniensis]